MAVRAAWAARAVAMAGSVNFALVDDIVIAVMAMDEKSQKHGNEEENAVPENLLVYAMVRLKEKTLHDPKSPACLQHSTLAVDIKSVCVSRDGDETKVGIVGAIRLPVGAVGISNASKLVDSAYESTHEEKVDDATKLAEWRARA